MLDNLILCGDHDVFIQVVFGVWLDRGWSAHGIVLIDDLNMMVTPFVSFHRIRLLEVSTLACGLSSREDRLWWLRDRTASFTVARQHAIS